MSIYKNYKELEGKILKREDKLYFKVGKEIFKYDTMPDFLYCDSHTNHDAIFKVLGISNSDEFGAKYYGYSIEEQGSCFPSSNIDDYKALTRIALALFAIVEDLDVEIEVPIEVVTIENSKVKVDKPIRPIVINLNSEYEAKVFKDKIVVGCQTIDKKQVLELVKAVNQQFK